MAVVPVRLEWSFDSLRCLQVNIKGIVSLASTSLVTSMSLCDRGIVMVAGAICSRTVVESTYMVGSSFFSIVASFVLVKLYFAVDW